MVWDFSDPRTRLIYADWLEERGDERSEIIRKAEVNKCVPGCSSWMHTDFFGVKLDRNQLLSIGVEAAARVLPFWDGHFSDAPAFAIDVTRKYVSGRKTPKRVLYEAGHRAEIAALAVRQVFHAQRQTQTRSPLESRLTAAASWAAMAASHVAEAAAEKDSYKFKRAITESVAAAIHATTNATNSKAVTNEWINLRVFERQLFEGLPIWTAAL